MATVSDELEATIAATCTAAGVDLVDVEFHSGALQVTVERATGLDLEDIAGVSRVLSEVLDAKGELVPGDSYSLEVSSPGLERRLRRPAHFLAAVGGLVALRTTPESAGARRIEGRLVVADDEGFAIDVEGDGRRRVAYREIERAHTVFDWREALRRAPELDESDDDTASTEGAAHADELTRPGGARATGARRGGHTTERESR